MKLKTNYPFIMLHGATGFGEDELLNKIVPYWGMLSCDILTHLNCLGFETHSPSGGGYSSAWDRACQTYAQLTGTRVDYGKAHSEKYGHERYGRTYDKPLIEKWDEKNKINIIGHSFGSNVGRLFITLLAKGSEEERAVTPEDELSPLFKGGNSELVHSFTSIAGANRGTSLLRLFKGFTGAFATAMISAYHMGSGTFVQKVQDLNMDQFGLSSKASNQEIQKVNRNLKKCAEVGCCKDNAIYDCSIEGAQEQNEWSECCKNVYYFAIACSTTKQSMITKKRREVPLNTTLIPFRPVARIIGALQKNQPGEVQIDEKWLMNDGMVNTISELNPPNEPAVDYHDIISTNQKVKPGVWHLMDVLTMDHLQVVGGLIPVAKPAEVLKIYSDHFRRICQLD
ncbi:MAG: hypothetical protein Q4E28_00300 [Clostridia bacterium]|nr:hypothetical protein [Clostridia bacterium]